MIEKTISTETARRLYDWLGRRHDVGERYERLAKERGLALLDLAPGQAVLNVGVGTGKEQRVLETAVSPNGLPVAIDISRKMLQITRERTGHTRLCEADIHALPFASASFDRLFCTYVLDLIPLADLPGILGEFRRALRRDGRIVLVSLTEGVDRSSKLVVGLWTAVYQISPVACGGCRPLHLDEMVQQAGFRDVSREVVVQMGVPSEVVTAVA